MRNSFFKDIPILYAYRYTLRKIIMVTNNTAAHYKEQCQIHYANSTDGNGTYKFTLILRSNTLCSMWAKFVLTHTRIQIHINIIIIV